MGAWGLGGLACAHQLEGLCVVAFPLRRLCLARQVLSLGSSTEAFSFRGTYGCLCRRGREMLCSCAGELDGNIAVKGRRLN